MSEVAQSARESQVAHNLKLPFVEMTPLSSLAKVVVFSLVVHTDALRSRESNVLLRLVDQFQAGPSEV